MVFGQSVGKSIDDQLRLNNAYPDRLIASKTLGNGNVENEYRWYGDCRYFYEFNPGTRVIVSWRFEGSQSECRLNP